jgi:type II secretory pathway component GspD/PulD (secretin)
VVVSSGGADAGPSSQNEGSSSSVEEESYIPGLNPISTRRVATTAIVDSDGILVIGGLQAKEATRSDQSVPILGSLPVIGNLFRNTQTTYSTDEMIIEISPHIVTPADIDANGLINPTTGLLPGKALPKGNVSLSPDDISPK